MTFKASVLVSLVLFEGPQISQHQMHSRHTARLFCHWLWDRRDLRRCWQSSSGGEPSQLNLHHHPNATSNQINQIEYQIECQIECQIEYQIEYD